MVVNKAEFVSTGISLYLLLCSSDAVRARQAQTLEAPVASSICNITDDDVHMQNGLLINIYAQKR